MTRTPPVVGPAERLACWLAALGPLGFFPIAPATFASLVLAGLFLLLPAGRPLTADLVVAVTIGLVGVWAADRAERVWGHDSGRIVIDEAAGMALTLLFMPPRLDVAVLGFVAFRFFDIIKPFPARRAERLPGGLGVVTDDLIAGVYAHIAVRVTLLVLGR